MGATSSRPTLRKQTSKNGSGNEDPASNNQNFRRLSKHRLSKTERANAISMNLQTIKSQIEQFDGFRGDSGYQNIQSELTKYSQEIQDVKSKSKPATKDVCSNIQADIVDLLRKLEEIVEKNEGELDLAAVESHSFIDQTPKANKKKVEPMMIVEEPPQRNVNVDRDRTMMNLSGLEESTATLMKEINRAIDLENTSEFVVFEKKIGILYADLTAMDIEKDDPLYERKESVSRKLIRYNNKLKTYKNRNSITADKEQQKAKKVEEELQVISQIEESLVDIEVKVMLFEDVKGDPKYRELDQTLKGYWAQLQGLDDSSEDNRRKKLRTINLIKTNLQALNNKAEENNTNIKAALEKINNLQEDVLALKVVVDNFQGFKNDLDYTNIDQTIRSLWAKLNDIHSTNSKVEQKKNETIKTIQSMLTILAQNAEKYEVTIGKEKLNKTSSRTGNTNNKKENRPDKLVGELSEFENRWKRLSSDIEMYLTDENQNNVEVVLKTLQNDIDICIKRLSDKGIDTKQVAVDSSSTVSNENQNQGRVNRSSVSIVKSKNDKPKNKATVNFQPEQILIDELSTSMENPRGPPRAASVENIIDEIEILQDRLKIITDEIKNSSPSECNELKRKLEDVENDLNSVETNLNPVVTESKAEVLKTIVSRYKMIEEKSKKDTKEESAKLKVIVENLQRLKKKVDCFSGTHGSIQYMQIHRELNECLSSLDNINCKDNEKLQSNKKQISQKIIHYLNILDERSLKVDSQENLIAEVEKESFVDNTNKLVDKLTEIRSKLEQYDLNKSNDFDKDFRDAKIILDHITPKTDEDNKNVSYYKEYLNQLVTYYQSKLNEIPPLLSLEEVVNNLKREATELNNITMENQNINQRISLTLTQIRNLPVEGESKTLKSKLMTDIKTIAVLLQTKDTILKDLDKVLDGINNFSGPNYQKKYDAIDEQLSEIFLKVEEIPVNSDEEYIHLRRNLIKRIQNHKKMLNAKMSKVKEPDSDIDGTEI